MNVFLFQSNSGQPNGAMRRKIEIFLDRIQVFTQRKHELLRQPDSPNRRSELSKIENEISRNKDALTRLCNN